MQGDSSVRFSSRDRQLGLLLLELFLHWPEWVHRRVEAISFTSPDTNRRRVSIDFTLPDEIEEQFGYLDPSALCLTPLTLLRKRPLTNFDFKDETGRALPLITKQHNAVLSGALLSGLAASSAPLGFQRAFGQSPPPDLDYVFHEIAISQGDERDIAKSLLSGVQADGASNAWAEHLVRDENFLWIAESLAMNYLVMVPLDPSPGRRRILKLAYDESAVSDVRAPLKRGPFRDFARDVSGTFLGLPINASRRSRLRRTGLRRALGLEADGRFVAAAGAGYGSSYHLEFVAPEGLNITRGFIGSEGEEKSLAGAAVMVSGRRTHLYASPDPSRRFGAKYFGYVDLRPDSSTLVRASALLAIFTTLLLLFVLWKWETMVEDSDALPSLLLVVPAGLAAVIVRPGEESLTTGMLVGTRLAVGFVGLCSFASAAVIVGGHTCKAGSAKACENWSSIPTVLIVLAAVCALVSLCLSLAWFCSARPPEQLARV